MMNDERTRENERDRTSKIVRIDNAIPRVHVQ
jgi:hypothetical protein